MPREKLRAAIRMVIVEAMECAERDEGIGMPSEALIEIATETTLAEILAWARANGAAL